MLAKPQTFMNLSGESVAKLMHRYNLSPEQLIVIYDDLDIPLGRIRIRERGSSGGHKGMKSIISRLGSQDFTRIRVGIAPPEGVDDTSSGVDVIEHVLSSFTGKEKPVINNIYDQVADAIYCIITEGLPAAMNKFN